LQIGPPLRTRFCVLLLACIAAGCRCENPAPPIPIIEPQQTDVVPTLSFDGIIKKAELTSSPGAKLTASEAELTVGFPPRSNFENKKLRVFVLGKDPSQKQAPIRVGQGGEVLRLPPGDYRLKLTYVAGEHATGQGTVRALKLPGGSHTQLTLAIDFEPAKLTLQLKNLDQEVNDDTSCWIQNADKTGLKNEIFAGETTLLSPGDYSVTIRWKPGPAFVQLHEQKIELLPGARMTINHDFKLQLRRVAVSLNSPRADLTDKTSITLLGNDAQTRVTIAARQAFLLPIGKHTLLLGYQDGPFINVQKEIRATITSGIGTQEIASMVDLTTGRLSLHIFNKERALRNECRCRFSRAKGQGALAEPLPCDTAFHLPSGQYIVQIKCNGGLSQHLDKVVIKSGQDRSQRVEL